MHRTLLSLAALSVAVASVTGQCALPTSVQTTFVANTVFGTPTVDPGPSYMFDLDVSAGLTITSLGVNLFNDGGTIGTTPPTVVPNMVGQNAGLQLWVIDRNAFGSVTTNINLTYSITLGTGPGGNWPANPSSTGTMVIAPNGTPSIAPMTPLHLNAGNYACMIVMVPNGTALGTTAPATNTLYPELPIAAGPGTTYGDQFLTVIAQGAQTAAFSGALAATAVPSIEIGYAVDAASAYSTNFGEGCYDGNQTFYTTFIGGAAAGGTTPAVVAAHPHILMLPLGSPTNQYFVQDGGGSFPLQGAPGSTTYFDTASAGSTPTHVNTGNPGVSIWGDWDDSNSVLYTLPFTLNYPGGSATQISIGSNGAVFMNTTASGPRWFPGEDYATWLSDDASFAVGYIDLWPADLATFQGGTGDIYCDSDGASWVAVTWVGVTEYPNTGASFSPSNSFQIVFNSSGIVEMAYGNFKSGNALPGMIGFTPGNGSEDPGSGPSPRFAPNLATAIPYLSGNGNIPMILNSLNRPRHGQPLLLESSNLDPSIMAVLTFISATSLPGGLDLGSLLGMPGCSTYILLPGVVDGLDLNLGAPTSTANFGVIPPLGPIDVYAQSAGLSIAVPAFNAQNVLVSNAVCLHVDAN